jgi:hypothetical protein
MPCTDEMTDLEWSQMVAKKRGKKLPKKEEARLRALETDKSTLQRRIDLLSRMLCSTIRKNKGLSLSKETQRWWAKHQASDLARKSHS